MGLMNDVGDVFIPNGMTVNSKRPNEVMNANFSRVSFASILWTDQTYSNILHFQFSQIFYLSVELDTDLLELFH